MLFQTIKNLFTSKKEKEEKFAQMMRSSTANVSDYIESMDEKGIAFLEVFQKLEMNQAQNWLNVRSKELFNDDPKRKMNCCRHFGSLPADKKSAMALYFAAYSYFLLGKDTENMEKEMSQGTGKLGAMQKRAQKAMAKTERDIAEAERSMRKVDRAIDQMNAQTERMIFGRSSQR